ncbi:MAG: hypothetical protein ACR2PK_02140, partial [Acidimicrobiales bacterium]
NNNRSIDDVFVASNGGINRISSDGKVRVDWVVNIDNPLTAHMFRTKQDSWVQERWSVTEVLRSRQGGWEAHTDGWLIPMTVDSPLDDWEPPASDFRPIVALGAQVGLLAAALTVLALYHPDVRFAGGGLFLGAVSILAVLLEAVPLQFGQAVPIAFAALALQYIRSVPNPAPAWLAAVGAAALVVLPLLVWKYTTAVPLRNVVVLQMLTLPVLLTGARLATADR